MEDTTWLLLGGAVIGAYFMLKKINLGGGSTGGLEPTADQLAAAAKTTFTLAANALPSVIAGARAANINTADRWAAWISQTAHETGGYRYLREIWGPTAQQIKYEPPSDLADTLGNINAGDGYRYRGRGLIQLTGRANYAAAGSDLGLDLENNPDAAAIAPGAGLVAAWYWLSRSINDLADNQDVVAMTRAINGGTTGLADRQDRYAAAQSVMASIAAASNQITS